jgi:hypothetical protein
MFRSIELAHILFSDKAPSVPVLEMECVDTFYTDGRKYTGAITPCRPTKNSYPSELVKFGHRRDAPSFSLRQYEFLIVDEQRVVLPLTFRKEKVQRFYLVDIAAGTVKVLNSLPFITAHNYYTQLYKLKDGKFLLYFGLHPLVILDDNFTPIEYCFVENAISLLFVDRDGACIMNLFGFDAEGQQGCGVARITGGDFTGIEGGVLEQQPEWGYSTPYQPVGVDVGM